ncbi:metallophosphoesterase [Alkalihalobacillus sp. MEB130]|uniref:metallophosphoesterase family protein n=1 Tax=Alkalihalobacillus sp. MEB130 TaxID=2976704 RepID=UPI0028E0066E|nr:metallophosphoesterase [Alkalihalobacillus sp. MEB130]MDT8859479.1 metallophosphoesterase [Alkalihalobacillus sp. MEB130]
MKAFIISDSHGWGVELQKVIQRHRNDVDLLIHCGDSELSAEDEALRGVKVVRGNCDFGVDFPEDRTEKVDGVTIYVTHGHLYNVKMTHVPLSYRAEEKGAQIACFGHSHVAGAFVENGVVYINPGSIRLPRNREERTYCICEYKDKKATVTYYDYNGSVVEDMIYQFEVN